MYIHNTTTVILKYLCFCVTLFEQAVSVIETWAQFHNQGFTLSVYPNNC